MRGIRIQRNFRIVIDLTEQVFFSGRSRIIGHQRDTLKAFQRIRIRIALYDRDTALSFRKAGGLGEPLDVQHRCRFFFAGTVHIDTIAIVCTCGSILFAVHADRERHIGDVICIGTACLHLRHCPTAQNHAANIACVDLCLTALPVSCSRVFFRQPLLYCLIQSIIYGKRSGHIVMLCKRILGVYQLVVFEICISRCTAADISIPCC